MCDLLGSHGCPLTYLANVSPPGAPGIVWRYRVKTRVVVNTRIDQISS